MQGMRTGVGIVVGAAFGLLLNMLFFDDWWVGPLIGVIVGLIIGAIVDAQAGSREPPPS